MLRVRRIDCEAANPQAIRVIVKTPTRNLNSVHVLTHSVPRIDYFIYSIGLSSGESVNAFQEDSKCTKLHKTRGINS